MTSQHVSQVTWRGICLRGFGGGGRWADSSPRDTWDTMGYSQQAGGMDAILLEWTLVLNACRICYSDSATQKIKGWSQMGDAFDHLWDSLLWKHQQFHSAQQLVQPFRKFLNIRVCRPREGSFKQIPMFIIRIKYHAKAFELNPFRNDIFGRFPCQLQIQAAMTDCFIPINDGFW